MNTGLTAFDSHHLAGESAIYAQADRPSGAHPLERLVVHPPKRTIGRVQLRFPG